MLSFWEKTSFTHFDAIVIGSGLVGLSTACSFKEKWPHKSVLILEKGILPTGASTKNAGFACYGSAAEIWGDVQLLGWDKALEIVELRVKGLHQLRARLGDKNIDYQEHGGGEIFLKGDKFPEDVVGEINRKLTPIFKKEVFKQVDDDPKRFGFQLDLIEKYLRNSVEGQIDTGKMMRNLLAFTQQKGVMIVTGASVQKPEWNGNEWEIELEQSHVKFKGSEVFVCTNAFTRELFPDLDVVPGRGQILITEPIENLAFKGIFHFDEGYYYFRNIGQRVLFGGGRNEDFQGETTTTFSITPKIQERLEYYLENLILPKGTPFHVEQRWAGIMAFGSEKQPILENKGNGLRIGCRMNGMGIAIGSEIGRQLVEMK